MKRKFLKSLVLMVSKLEKNSIFYKEWNEAITESNHESIELSGLLENCFTIKKKLVTLLKFKLNSILKILKDFQKVISQEKVTQTLINTGLGPLKQELASAFYPQLSISCLRLITEMHLASRDYQTAAKSAHAWFMLADIFGESADMLSAVEVIGHCQRDQRLYSECLSSYWKQVYLAWSINDVIHELRAYDNLGLAFFYLNDTEKAIFYHTKAVKGESELEAGDAAHKMGERYIEERKRKKHTINLKNQFYRYSLMKDILVDEDYLGKPESMKFVEPLLTNFDIFDGSPIKAPKREESKGKLRIVLKPTPLGNRLKDLREKQFKCNFTKDGLLHSLRRSNPVKFDLIERGVLQLDSQMLQEIDLRDGANINSNILTHQSQNKSAEAFVSYHNFSSLESDICLEYITIDIKSKLQQKISTYSCLFLSILQAL